MFSSGYIRVYSPPRDALALSLAPSLLSLSPSETSMPNFLHAAAIRPLTSDRFTPFIGYCEAFFGMLMYAHAALACSAVSMGYLPFLGSA